LLLLGLRNFQWAPCFWPADPADKRFVYVYGDFDF